MKKFSKLTAVILTALLLCGLVVPFAASAAEGGGGNNFNVSGSPDNIYTDFTNPAATSGAGSFNANTNNSSISRVRVLGADGNYYQRHSWSGTNSAKAIEDTWFPGSQSVAVAGGVVNDLGKYDYSVWDFDIGTDMYRFSYAVTVNNGSADSQGTLSMTVASQAEFEEYLEEFELYKADSNADIEKYPLMKKLAYTASGKTVKSIDSIDANQTLDLAFLPSTLLGYTFRGYTYNADATAWAASNKEVWGRVAKFEKQADGWYLVDNKNADNKVKLVNEIGKFDHITYVFKIVEGTANADGRTRMVVNLYTFINGEYFNTIAVSNNVYEQLLPQRLSFCYPNGSLLSYGWAFAADNFANNLYSNYDTTNTGGIGALIDSIVAGTATDKSIYNCNDVLYDKTYVSPNGFVSVDGVKGSLPTYIDELLANAKDGAVIETTFDLLNFELPEGVETVTVKTLGDAKFKLGAASAENFVAVRGAGGVYTIRRGTDDDYVTLKWTYISEGVPTLLKSEKIAFDVMPTFTPEGATLADFDVSAASDWMFDVDGNASNFGPNYNPAVNLYDAEKIRAITWLEVLLIREELGGELMVYTGDGSEITANLSANETVIDNSANEDNLLQSNESTDTSEQNAPKNELNVDVNSSKEIPVINENETPAIEENSKAPENNSGALLQSSEPKQNTASTLSQSFVGGAEAPAVESVSETNSSAWLGFVISILVVAVTVAMISKHRSET